VPEGDGVTHTVGGVAPMRKLFSALAVMLFMAGLVLATDGTITKVDLENKKITLKEGDKETEYKFTDKVKVTLVTGKKGEEKESEGKYEDWEKQLKAFKADAKFGNKITFEAKDGEVTEVKVRMRGKKTKD
jgi:hypothetical protein